MDTHCVVVLLCFCALWLSVRGQSCEISYYEHCLKQLLQFTDRPELNFADSSAHLKTQCVEAQTAVACLDRYSLKCLSSEERLNFSGIYSGPEKLTTSLCTEGNDLRTSYLRSVHCIRNMSEGLRYCREKFDRNQRDIHLVAYENEVQLLCCSFEGYRRCLSILMSAQNDCASSDESLVDIVDKIIVQRAVSTDACAPHIEHCLGSGTLKVSMNPVLLLVVMVTNLLIWHR